MGKRNDELTASNEETVQDIPQDENPEFVFTGPRSGINQIRRPSREELREQIYNLSPFLRQWVNNFLIYSIFVFFNNPFSFVAASII